MAMNPYPHCNNAPTAGQVMRQAVIREDQRRERRQWWINSATHALYFVAVVLGTVALMIN